MTSSEMEEYGKKKITITREEVACIMASRIAKEKKVMTEADLSPVQIVMFSEIITHICADIMREMFDKEELEVEE